MKIGNLEVYGIIYKITNLVNGKVYIGQTIQEGGFDTRYYRSGEGIERVYLFHKYKKDNKKTYNKHLLGSIQKYGFKNFEVDKVFDIAFSQEELDVKEKCWIKYYDSYRNGYNKTIGGCGHGGGALDEQWRKNISKGCKGKIVHNELKNQISKTMSKKMICLNNFRTFDSLKEGEEIFGISKFYISRCCRGQNKKTVHPITKISYVFLYYENYLKMNSEEIKKIKKEFIDDIHKDVICLNTQKIFTYAQLFEEKLYNTRSVKLACEGELKTTGKDPVTGERLRWKYIKDLTPEEYIKYDVENKLRELHNKDLRQAI